MIYFYVASCRMLVLRAAFTVLGTEETSGPKYTKCSVSQQHVCKFEKDPTNISLPP